MVVIGNGRDALMFVEMYNLSNAFQIKGANICQLSGERGTTSITKGRSVLEGEIRGGCQSTA